MNGVKLFYDQSMTRVNYAVGQSKCISAQSNCENKEISRTVTLEQ